MKEELIRCDKCIHCTHVEQCIDEAYYYCEISDEYVAEHWAISTTPCDAYVEKLDDNETEKP